MTKEQLKKALKEIEDEKVETEATETAEEATEEGEKTEEAEVEVNVDEKLLDQLGDKIVKAIADKKGLGVTDQENIKGKFFNPKSGFEGIKYPSDLNSLSKEEKIVTFFKAMIGRDAESQRVTKALVEGTDSQGGYLVPEELRAEVWRLLPDYSVMRKLARVIPMSTDTLNLNTLTAKPEAYWTDEYASKTTSSAEFGQVTLSPNKLVCLLPLSEELIEDANIDIVQFIVELFAERIGQVEDKAYFTGSGTGQPTGLMGSLGTSVNAGNAIGFDHILNLIYGVPQSVRRSKRSAFVAPANVIKSLRKVKDTDNNYIWSAGQPENGEPERLYGYPLWEQNDLGHNQLVYGDFSYYIIGDRRQLIVRTTMEGGDSWRRDAMEIKAKIRVDGKTVLTTPFAKLINA